MVEPISRDSHSLDFVFLEAFASALGEELHENWNETAFQENCIRCFGGFGPLAEMQADIFREFISSNAADFVSFDPERFNAWKKDVEAFCKLNAHVFDFQNLFVHSSQFKPALEAMSRVIITDKMYRTYIVENFHLFRGQLLELYRSFDVDNAPVDGKNRREESKKFLAQLQEILNRGVVTQSQLSALGFRIAAKAWLHEFFRPAIDVSIHRGLAAIAKWAENTRKYESKNEKILSKNRRYAQQILEIKTSSSFQNKRGIIPFQKVGPHLQMRLGQDAASSRNIVRVQLNKSISEKLEKMELEGTIDRCGNYDLQLSKCLSSYRASFLQSFHDDANIINLWLIGQEIQGRLDIDQLRDSSERVSPDLIGQIQTLVLLHQIYMNNFQVIEQMSEQARRTAVMYESINQSYDRLSKSLFHKIAAEEGIFDYKTKKVIDQYDEVLQQDKRGEKKGFYTIVTSMLRGSLLAMAGVVMGKIIEIGLEKIISKISDLFENFVKETELAKKLFLFFCNTASDAIELAEQIPSYFGWVKKLIDLLKK